MPSSSITKTFPDTKKFPGNVNDVNNINASILFSNKNKVGIEEAKLVIVEILYGYHKSRYSHYIMFLVNMFVSL